MGARILKFIQINIYKGRYLNSLLDFLKDQDPDIIAMQEVTAGELNLCDKNLDLFEYFKAELSLNGVIDKVMKPVDSPKSYLGNAVFSKNQIIDSKSLVLKTFNEFTLVKIHDFKNFTNFPRNLLSAECVLDGQKIRAISWHAAWTAPPTDTKETWRQAKIVRDYLLDLKSQNAPFILGGDLNSTMDKETVKMISEVSRNLMESSNVVQTTHPKIHKIAPRGFLIDYIFTSSHFKLKKLEVSEITISDHLPVVAELEFNPED